MYMAVPGRRPRPCLAVYVLSKILKSNCLITLFNQLALFNQLLQSTFTSTLCNNLGESTLQIVHTCKINLDINMCNQFLKLSCRYCTVGTINLFHQLLESTCIITLYNQLVLTQSTCTCTINLCLYVLST